MIVAIQQPEHAPWLGFFHKMTLCDVFVYLDNVQFKRRYFENRNRIRDHRGVRWITAPVASKGRFKQRIDEAAISDQTAWVRKYQGRLHQAYGAAPHWDAVRTIVWPCLASRARDLVSLNLSLIEAVCGYLGVSVETVRASSLPVEGRSGSDLILAICQHLGGDAYLSGPDGRNYLDAEAFAAGGVALSYHDYEHPVYTQTQRPFASHLSILDLIANCGPASGEIVRRGGRLEASV